MPVCKLAQRKLESNDRRIEFAPLRGRNTSDLWPLIQIPRKHWTQAEWRNTAISVRVERAPFRTGTAVSKRVGRATCGRDGNHPQCEPGYRAASEIVNMKSKILSYSAQASTIPIIPKP